MDSILATPAGEPFPYKQYFMEKKEAGRVFVGIFAHEMVPVELVRAAGATIVPLVFVGPEEYSATGGSFMSHSTCTFARNIVGAFVHEDMRFYKQVEYLVRSNYCNGDFCGMEYLGREFRLPTIDLSVPVKTLGHSVAYFTSQVEAFAQRLGSLLGARIEEDETKRQVKVHNAARAAIRRLLDVGIYGSELLQRYQEAAVLEPAELVERLDAIYFKNEAFLSEGDKRDTKHPGIMLSGDPIFVNDFFASWLEEFGASVVYYDTWIGARLGETDVDEADPDVYNALARAYLLGHGLERAVPAAMDSRLRKAMTLVKERNITGIINHTLKFCDFQAIGRGEFKDQLGKLVPVLDVERDYSQSGFGGMKTRVEAFIELVSGGGR
ncbi:MAG: 2-hydroxyacyl-CoA dehydratase [Candidatus Lokiarchaeota archaeon]|nr:2-hydroxyacyl-CoA dehydratase [Candidatus Lokiarchaeota archaeon]